MTGIGESGEQILLPAVLSLIALWAARALGFFTLPTTPHPPNAPRIAFWQVVSVFAIYLSCSLFIPILASHFLAYFFPQIGKPEFGALTTMTPTRIAYSQVAALLASALFFTLFCLLQKDKASMRGVWKRARTPPSSIKTDIGMGMMAWLVSFPIVSIVGTIADLLINWLFGLQKYEQVAVKYLKNSLESNFLITLLALITIILAAPVIEEFLFRGFLQNFLKRHVGTKAAILLTAFTFSLFHFSLSQDLGNIPLVASLFALALFLGFIYERQQSLFASIALHITFNSISVLRIVFT